MAKLSFTCPRCGAVSYHPKDRQHGYCGACKEFTVAAFIFEVSKAARDRGVLSIWTVYDHPADFPAGFVARRFETGGGTPQAVVTADVVIGELDMIREAMTRCGLYCMPRAEVDHPNVMESWL